MKSEIDTKYINEWMNDAIIHGIQPLMDAAKDEAFDNASFAMFVNKDNRAVVQFSSEDGYNSVDLLEIAEAYISKKLPNEYRLGNIGRLICALDEIKRIAELEIKRVIDLGDTVVEMPQ